MPTDLPTNENANRSASPPPEGQNTPRGNTPPPDGSSLHIITLFGIPIRLHWTFFALLAFLAFPAVTRNSQSRASWTAFVFVLALFACVALHELGHALIARRYGIRTRDIVLTPIGGVSRLETLPRPRQELWIALAGPTVNLIIAIIMYLALKSLRQPIGSFPWGGTRAGLAADLMWANGWLFVFNLLPAFPMDGGRVLRALLARGMDETTATLLAARIGQGLAILLGLFSLLSANLLLLFVAVFVFLGAGQEAAAFTTRTLMEGHRVREAMLREFHTLPTGATLREAADLLLAGSQHDFPVMNGEEVVGILTRSDLLRGLAQEGPDAYVAGTMEREPTCVRPDADLETVLPMIPQSGSMLVMEGDTIASSRLVGMLTQENLYEFLVLTQLKAQLHN